MSSILDVINKQLEALDVRTQRKVIRQWQAYTDKYLKDICKRLNPFSEKGKKAKAIYRVFKSAGDSKQTTVKVWGTRPGIINDPENYPRIPSSGFKFGQKHRVTMNISGSNIYRYSNKRQEHYYEMNPKPWPDYHKDGTKEYYFNQGGLVWKHIYGGSNNMTFPIFSQNSIPRVIENYPKMSREMEKLFDKALKTVLGRMAKNDA